MIEQLSFSSITAYLNCPRAWKFKYIEKSSTRKSGALAFGTAFHETVENYVSRGNEGREIRALWAAAWQKQSEANHGFDDETPKSLYNDGLRMFSSPKVMVALDSIEPPREIELPVSLNVPGVPPVTGFVDMLAADGVPSDFKISRSKWSDNRVRSSLQALFYLAALKQMQIETPLKFRHYVFIKNREPGTQLLETEYRYAQFLFLFSVIQHVWSSIQANAFHENPESWQCQTQYCDFWRLCRGRFSRADAIG